MSNLFQLQSKYTPAGDQPTAIASLTEAFDRGEKCQTLMGVTGSGKTFTMAHVIAQLGVPTLVMAHNKTLAAQLHEEFRALFPDNAVEYFVSYYDYYQPEAYVPSSDTYIDKDSTINDAIDRMRHAATRALLERRDVIIVASVSCIYGLGAVEAYSGTTLFLQVGQELDRDTVVRHLVDIQYERNEIDFHRGTFRVRGDVLEVFPAHEAEQAVRIEWFGDQVEAISLVDPLRGLKLRDLTKVSVYPSSHYVVTAQARERALTNIRQELGQRLTELRDLNQLVEAQRLEQRTLFDLEMLQQMGYCNGIENYTRHLTGRPPGEPPPTLTDYFPDDFLLILDESHQTVPQIGAMYKGDRARKETLVRYGFRLPSALDNRPLKFDEFAALQDRVLYVSATPGDFELQATQGVVVEQIIRPTGLVDPLIDIRPARNQVDNLLEELRQVVAAGMRVLITVLTKRMAEDLTEFLVEAGMKVRYLHADVDTLDRIALLRDLRLGTYDALVGINLLREGLDLPEVGLVAVLDADKEGFLRSARSLIQTIGRAARNSRGRVILYADRITGSMQLAIDETDRRRTRQLEHNVVHGITPRSTERSISILPVEEAQGRGRAAVPVMPAAVPAKELPGLLASMRQEMRQAAEALDFERAARLRDQIAQLEIGALGLTP